MGHPVCSFGFEVISSSCR